MRIVPKKTWNPPKNCWIDFDHWVEVLKTLYTHLVGPSTNEPFRTLMCITRFLKNTTRFCFTFRWWDRFVTNLHRTKSFTDLVTSTTGLVALKRSKGLDKSLDFKHSKKLIRIWCEYHQRWTTKIKNFSYFKEYWNLAGWFFRKFEGLTTQKFFFISWWLFESQLLESELWYIWKYTLNYGYRNFNW